MLYNKINIKPTLHSHTSKTTDQQKDEKEHRTGNRRLAQWLVKRLIEHYTLHQLLWCIDNSVRQKPLLRKAAKR